MKIEQQTNEIVILKSGKEVFFSHYEKKNGNGSYWFDTNGNKHHIKDIA